MKKKIAVRSIVEFLYYFSWFFFFFIFLLHSLVIIRKVYKLGDILITDAPSSYRN